MTLAHSGLGLRFFDVDNDGWKDLLIVQRHDLDTIDKTSPGLHYREPLLLVRNTGHGLVAVSKDAGETFFPRRPLPGCQYFCGQDEMRPPVDEFAVSAPSLLQAPPSFLLWSSLSWAKDTPADARAGCNAVSKTDLSFGTERIIPFRLGLFFSVLTGGEKGTCYDDSWTTPTDLSLNVRAATPCTWSASARKNLFPKMKRSNCLAAWNYLAKDWSAAGMGKRQRQGFCGYCLSIGSFRRSEDSRSIAIAALQKS
jgi:hypothetical protein